MFIWRLLCFLPSVGAWEEEKGEGAGVLREEEAIE